MNAFSSIKIPFSRVALSTVFAFGLLGLTVGQGRGETFTTTLDEEFTFSELLHTFNGLSPNTTLSFQLILAQPHSDLTSSSLTFDILYPDSSFASSVTFDAGSSTAGSNDYHSINEVLSSPLQLFDDTRWQVDLGSAFTSVSIVFTSFFVADLNATLIVTTDGTSVGETPLPGALPLFASGLGMLAWTLQRRRRHG